MELNGIASLRKGFGFFRVPNPKKSTSEHHPLEAMVGKEKGNGGVGVVSCREEDGGVVRMKIVVKKSELKQLVQVMSGVKGEAQMEQRLNMLWEKHQSRAKPLNRNCHKFCSSSLQSIPEEN